MDQMKINSLIELINTHNKNYDLFLRYGENEEIFLEKGDAPRISDDGWLTCGTEDKNLKFVHLGSIYEIEVIRE